VTVPGPWLGHADARQVYDLARRRLFKSSGSQTLKAKAVIDRLRLGAGVSSKSSETCYASAWPSHNAEAQTANKTASTAGNGWDDRNLSSSRNSTGKATRESDVLFADENIYVLANLTSLGRDPISQPRKNDP
jgi:hypothetical protein